MLVVLALAGSACASQPTTSTPSASTPSQDASVQTSAPPLDASVPPTTTDTSPPGTVGPPSVEPTGDTDTPTPGTTSGTTPLSPGASPQAYVVQPGDSLSGIAQRFGLTVGELLAANPEVDDPNQIQAGDELTIPPPGGGPGIPAAAEISDARGDVLDEEDQPAFAPAYVDIAQFGARFAGADLVVGIRVGVEPPPLDPDVEAMDYVVAIDTTGDDRPDYQLLITNATLEPVDYGPRLTDLATGTALDGIDFPGTVELDGDTLRLRVGRDAIGNPLRASLAALSRRQFFPNGRADPEVQEAIDRAPDQQFPRPNPDWLEIGFG